MQWLVVVMFATFHGDIYIFTEPEFETREECLSTIVDPYHITKYTKKLLLEYGKAMPIQNVNCLQSDTIDRLLSGVGEQV
tara:strand:- start:651 stop:890 length:240 start_codon:yes stop_codon:yes gene_type:complete